MTLLYQHALRRNEQLGGFWYSVCRSTVNVGFQKVLFRIKRTVMYDAPRRQDQTDDLQFGV